MYRAELVVVGLLDYPDDHHPLKVYVSHLTLLLHAIRADVQSWQHYSLARNDTQRLSINS